MAAYNSRRPSDFEKVRAFESSMHVIPFDLDAARLYGQITSHLKKRGMMINVQDVVMASIAMSRGERVVTRDRHLRRIPGLGVIGW